jgi:4,5-dihydroxyphthalate decarboxylase
VNIALTLAINPYDHVRDLLSGEVRAPGIDLVPLELPIEEIFYRFTKFREWQASEMSFGKVISLMSEDRPEIICVPVFLSRVFRHSAIYLPENSPIRKPKDLEGKRVGIPEWAQTAGIYVRGFLAEGYGVDLSKVHWLQAGVDQPGRAEKVELKLPAGIRYEGRPQTSLSAMLASGEIDAVVSARAPESFSAPDGKVVRLFPHYRAEEERFFKQTGIFPIMHVMTIRRAVFEQHPWVAMNLYKMFDEAKRRCLARLRDFTCARIPLPWAAAMADEIAQAYGPDPYPYGVEPNRTTIEAFCWNCVTGTMATWMAGFAVVLKCISVMRSITQHSRPWAVPKEMSVFVALLLVLSSQPAYAQLVPTISHIVDQTTDEDTPTALIPFGIFDLLTPLHLLTVSASSSKKSLVPDANIEVDMIVLATGRDGLKDLSFTVHRDDFIEAQRLMRNITAEFSGARMTADDKVAKLAVVGVGMRSAAGVATQLFESLARQGVKALLISTSEIKIAVLVPEEALESCVKCLHKDLRLS